VNTTRVDSARPASTQVTIIINPISGTGSRLDIVRDRVAQAASLAGQRGVTAQVLVSERAGHATELAARALAEGTTTVLAWGGDGTINDIGAVLAFRNVTLGIIPSGSGNGLARELGIPFEPDAAFEIALRGSERAIDCGELDGRLFFNIAGIGLDARVAHEFAAHGLERRGFRRYLEITARELFQYVPDEHAITVDGATVRVRALMIALANGRQYGNGALIAPQANLNDGLLDVVIVENRSPWRALMQVPRIFMGRIANAPGVTMLKGERVEITSGRPVIYHVDGEPFVGSAHVTARVHRAALRVRVR
jgi:diacylglycerol kinase (ATP)